MTNKSISEVESNPRGLKRSLSWKNAFWLSSGSATLVLFSISQMASTVGTPSWIIWGASSIIGFIQLFAYAEISGMFHNKSGGASVYGSIAWEKYGTAFSAINIWAYWLSWSPILAVGAATAGTYIVSSFFSGKAFEKFSITLLDLSAILPGISIKLDGSIIFGAAILLIAFYIQHTGVLRAAKTQFFIALLSLIPVFLLSTVPLLTGKVNLTNFTPLVPKGTNGWFSGEALKVVMGGMFIAAWTTYAAETTVCYVSEFKQPSKDVIRALTSTGLLAMVFYILLPFTFLGVLGMKKLSDPAFAKGDVQAGMVELAQAAFGPGSGLILTGMLTLAVILTLITAMAGSSRTLYQASVDGWLPKYLDQLNKHDVPTNAMWSDLFFNLFLLSLDNPIFVLAASNVGYLIAISMDMIAALLHRKDRPNHQRPYRAPHWLIYFVCPLLVVLNVSFIIFGANVFAPNALWYGLGAVLLVLPIFWYRHYVVDKGVWPSESVPNEAQ